MLVSSSAVSGGLARTTSATASRPGMSPHGLPNPCSNWSQPGLVAVDVPGGVGQDHGDDVLLDEGEDVAVGVAADLVEQALLAVVEAADAGDAGDALGKERLGEVEV